MEDHSINDNLTNENIEASTISFPESSYMPNKTEHVPQIQFEEEKKSPLPFILVGVGVLLILGVVSFFTYKFFHGPLSDKDQVLLSFAKTFGNNSVFAVMGGFEDQSGNGTLLPTYVDDFITAKNTVTNIIDQGAETKVHVKIDNYEDEYAFLPLNGAGLTLSGEFCPKQGSIYQKLKVSYMGLNMSDFEALLTRDELDITAKGIKGYLSIPTLKFGKNYNEADYSINYGEELPEHLTEILSFDPLSIASYPTINLKTFMESEAGKVALADLYEAIEVERTGKEKSFTVFGKKEDCAEFTISLKKKAMKKFYTSYYDWSMDTLEDFFEDNEWVAALFLAYTNEIDEYSEDFVADVMAYLEYSAEDKNEFMDSLFSNDFDATVYLDPKGNLVCFDNDFTFSSYYEDYTANLHCEWAGEQYLCDNYKIDFTAKDSSKNKYYIGLQNDGYTENNVRKDKTTFTWNSSDFDEEREIVFNSSYEFDEKRFHVDFDYEEPSYWHEDEPTLWDFEIEGDLKIEEDSFAFNIDEFKIHELDTYWDEEYELTLSGEIELDVLDEPTTSLSGKKYELFKMDEDEIDDFTSDSSSNSFFRYMLMYMLY